MILKLYKTLDVQLLGKQRPFTSQDVHDGGLLYVFRYHVSKCRTTRVLAQSLQWIIYVYRSRSRTEVFSEGFQSSRWDLKTEIRPLLLQCQT